MSSAGLASGSSTPTHGRTRITSRALETVIRAIAAEELGADASGTSVDIDDAGGDLSVHIRTKLRIPPLTEIVARASLGNDKHDGPVLDRVDAASLRIRERSGELTGSRIDRVVIEVTGAISAPKGRVQ